MKRTFIPLLFLATLTVSACVTAGDTQTATEQPLPVPDVSSLKPEWIQNDCNNTRMTYASYQLCLAYIASQLPPFDPAKREHFGEQYSPQKFLQCARKGRPIDGACEQYRLRRVENPEYWPYPDVPKPKWPEAPKEPVYKPGMSSKEYFEALCKAEAGEFIYKTVGNVEGVYQVRPRTKDERQNNDLYAIEDPYVIDNPSSPQADTTAGNFLMPNRYRFFESPNQNAEATNQSLGKLVRFFVDGDNKQKLKNESTESPKAQYGYVWRGIQRPHDRANEIAGSELVVLDLRTNEVLAIRRGFSRRDYIPHTMPQKWWGANSCPKLEPFPIFLLKVLKSVSSSTLYEGNEK